MSNDDAMELNAEISKRKLLGGLGVLGGGAALGGVGTLALLSDSESFGNPGNANIIQSGEVDLEVDWEVVYFGPGSSPETIDSQTEPVDRPGPIVNVTDLKPGDIIEKTLSTHINGNPAFLTFDLSVFVDEDNGINNPEDAVNGAFDDSDGTEGGDLAENLNCVVWYDGFEPSDNSEEGSSTSPGNNRPDEGGIWKDDSDPTDDEDFEAALDSAGSPSDVFDIESDLVIASGTLAELANTEEPILIDSRDQGDKPADYSDSACYDNGAVQYIGCVCWLPRDIPGVDDNIIQTDRLEYQFGFGAIQCRDNVAEDGTPISTDVADQPGGGSDPPVSLDSPTGIYTIGEDATVSGTASGGVTEVAIFALGTEFWYSVELDGQFTLQVQNDGTFSTQATLSSGSGGGNTILSSTGSPYIGVIDTADISGSVDSNTVISIGDFGAATTDREQIQVEQPISLNNPATGYTIGEETYVSGTAFGGVTEVAIVARDGGDWEIVELDGQFTMQVQNDGAFSTQATLSSGSGGGNGIFSVTGDPDIGVIDTADISGSVDSNTTIPHTEFEDATTDSHEITVTSA